MIFKYNFYKNYKTEASISDDSKNNNPIMKIFSPCSVHNSFQGVTLGVPFNEH